MCRCECAGVSVCRGRGETLISHWQFISCCNNYFNSHVTCDVILMTAPTSIYGDINTQYVNMECTWLSEMGSLFSKAPNWS